MDVDDRRAVDRRVGVGIPRPGEVSTRDEFAIRSRYAVLRGSDQP